MSRCLAGAADDDPRRQAQALARLRVLAYQAHLELVQSIVHSGVPPEMQAAVLQAALDALGAVRRTPEERPRPTDGGPRLRYGSS